MTLMLPSPVAPAARPPRLAVRSATLNGQRVVLVTHRVLLDAQPGEWVIHRNHQPLDNTVATYTPPDFFARAGHDDQQTGRCFPLP